MQRFSIVFWKFEQFRAFDIETFAFGVLLNASCDWRTHWCMFHLFEGLEDGSRLHRINTSTTYISTRRKNQLASGKTLLTEVCCRYLKWTEMWKGNIWFLCYFSISKQTSCFCAETPFQRWQNDETEDTNDDEQINNTKRVSEKSRSRYS